MNDFYFNFINRYNIKNIRTVPDIRRFDYYRTQYKGSDDKIEMELPSSSFEHLVNLDYERTRFSQDQRDEKYIRDKHPIVAEAYSKYRMLLELYK